MPDDRGRPDRDAADPHINWAVGFAPEDTDLFFHHEVTIAAPVDVVFAGLTDATAWGAWYPGVSGCDAPAALALGQMFKLEYLSRSLDVSVGEFQPPDRFGWAGVSADLSAYHAWLLRPRTDGIHVVLEVSARGPAAAGISRSRAELLTANYRKLLLRLKQRVELADAG